jgi:hypothetical protein
VKEHNVAVDLGLVDALVTKPRGVAIPISQHGLTMDKFLYASRHVENRLPEGANWNGKEELLVSAEQFEAARNGVILPKESEKKVAAPVKKAPAPATTKTTQVAKPVAVKKVAAEAVRPAAGSAPAGSR